MSKAPFYFVFDVESIGLHGEGFAFGVVVINATGEEVDSWLSSCAPEHANGAASDLAWVKANCPPLVVDCESPGSVRAVFWKKWLRWREKGVVMVADCAWPVEARFLAACVDADPEGRRWLGPYPLHDVATARLAAGLDPLGMVDRLPVELPKHDPLADARQSARLWIESLRAVAS